MAKLPELIPVTDLRQGATAILARLKESEGPYVITQRGRASAVLVSYEEYQRQQKDLDILKLLVKGDEEIEAGEGSDFESVMAKARAILGKSRP